MNSLTAIIVAIIGGGGPLMFLMSRFDRRNTEQHNVNMEILKDIRSDVRDVQKDVKSVDQRLSRHIDWHSHEKTA